MKLGLELGTGDKPQYPKGIKVMIHTDKFPQSKGIKKLDANKKFPFPNNYFDVVIAFGILEHVEDFYFTVNEIHRVLKLNGLFKCDLPHFSSSQYYWEGDHKRHGHSRIFHSYIEEGDKGMRGQSENRRFELKKFDFCVFYGKIIKPLINFIGFQRYEKRLARTLLFDIDFLFFDLIKKGFWK